MNFSFLIFLILCLFKIDEKYGYFAYGYDEDLIENVAGVISHYEAKILLSYRDQAIIDTVKLKFSINLGVSKSPILLNNEGLCILEKNVVCLSATWDELKEIVDKFSKGQSGCYVIYSDGSKPWRASFVSRTSGMPVTLCPPLDKAGAPTLILGGFTMHRVSGENMNPMIDTSEKISGLEINENSIVLDTCMGLGYTAIAAAKKIVGVGRIAAGHLTTVEIDDASVDMAKINPWSAGLFDGTLPVKVLRGNVCDLVVDMPPASVDTIIHDPPARAICSTDLYGLEFYKQLRRILKPKGTLFHYIGNPESKESGSLYPGVVNRLQSAGFELPTNYKVAFGVIANPRKLSIFKRSSSIRSL